MGAMWVAGVLLRWERPAEELRGLVAYVVADDSGSPVLVTQALSAGLIRPAGSWATARVNESS